ncbi:MAG: hypothetical protein A3G75_13190 [Verrucomicrobia bacterium RIFCSPLOWO2_12_FULL_64_8]|nr:MAG: hypothetical protein A3G75_13190 [Verrucomicrobia bacterium RIFCSPLOWO2_12_FULL_64_8]
MAISSKVDKAKHGPSMFEVGLGAVLSVALGLILAVGYLVAKPARAVKEMPKDDKREAGVVYYIEGTKDSNRSRQWRQKKQQFLDGKSVVMNEDEVNAWLASGAPPPVAAPAAKPPAPAKPGAPKPPEQKTPAAEAPGSGSQPFVSAGQLNFRFHDGVVQVAVPCSLTIDLLGVKQLLTVLATGRFEKSGDGFSFVPDKYYFGSCAGHRMAGLGVFMRLYVAGKLKLPEDIGPAWKKLTDVAVEGTNLKLTMP